MSSHGKGPDNIGFKIISGVLDKVELVGSKLLLKIFFRICLLNNAQVFISVAQFYEVAISANASGQVLNCTVRNRDCMLVL